MLFLFAKSGNLTYPSGRVKSRPSRSPGEGRGSKTQSEDQVKSYFLSPDRLLRPHGMWVLPALGREGGPCRLRRPPDRALITSSTFKKEHLFLNPHLAWSQRGPDAHVPSHPPLVTAETTETQHKQVTYSPAPLTLLSGAQRLGLLTQTLGQKTVAGSRALQRAAGSRSGMFLSLLARHRQAPSCCV